MVSAEAKALVMSALKANQTATEAMNSITAIGTAATNIPQAVFDVLYQQGEAIGQLATALLEICDA